MMNIELDPIIGSDYNLRDISKILMTKIEDWVSQQLIAFEKVDIEIPMTDQPVFIPRYDSIFKQRKTRDVNV